MPKLAKTPPMGWNSWNAYGCDINESKVKAAADAIVDGGYKDAGYEYVNIDDCWQAPNRDANGRLVPDPKKFPDGIKGVANYVHSKGLKLGLYATPGSRTCANIYNGYSGRLGSMGHVEQDARTFASWGVDYLKYDWCRADEDGLKPRPAFTEMRDALKATGRPIVYSIHREPELPMDAWRPNVANLWRTTPDIRDNWASLKSIIDHNAPLAKYARPGAWNDPDMLEVGNGGMADTEYRTHFSLWAEMAAPLLIGTDLQKADPETKRILTNKDVIAVDQDRLGIQGRVIADHDGTKVFDKPLARGDHAVALYNGADTAVSIETTAAELGIRRHRVYRLKNLWSGERTVTTGTIRADVPVHGTVLYRVSTKGR